MTEPPQPPEPSQPPRVPAAHSLARTVVLGTVAFAATLILLFGLLNVVRRAEGGSVTAPPTSAAQPRTISPSQGAAASAPSASVGNDPVLVGAGDIADCALDSGAATAALLDTIAGTVFTAGDNAYPDGTADQFRRCYEPTWGRHFARTRPAAGNHDWVTANLAGYLGYFGKLASPNGTSWYSYDLGTWHVVVLDSDCSSVAGCGHDSEQGRWLASDLGASTAQCTLAIWHHPRFSSGEHGNDPTVVPFWEALHAAGAEVVVNGHDHDYERFSPQDPSGNPDPARGIREFVVGTGGAELREFPKFAANSELRVATTHGVIRFVLRRASYEWSFIPTTGDLTDAGQGSCH